MAIGNGRELLKITVLELGKARRYNSLAPGALAPPFFFAVAVEQRCRGSPFPIWTWFIFAQAGAGNWIGPYACKKAVLQDFAGAMRTQSHTSMACGANKKSFIAAIVCPAYQHDEIGWPVRGAARV